MWRSRESYANGYTNSVASFDSGRVTVTVRADILAIIGGKADRYRGAILPPVANPDLLKASTWESCRPQTITRLAADYNQISEACQQS